MLYDFKSPLDCEKARMRLENLIVISDDLNLPFGTLRMRKNGSAGGHNGLSNITEMLGSQDYARIRIGIGNNFSRGGQVDFVLGDLSEEEQEQMPGICEKVISGIKAFATAGPDRTMNTFNAKPKPSSTVDAPQDGKTPASDGQKPHPDR